MADRQAAMAPHLRLFFRAGMDARPSAYWTGCPGRKKPGKARVHSLVSKGHGQILKEKKGRSKPPSHKHQKARPLPIPIRQSQCGARPTLSTCRHAFALPGGKGPAGNILSKPDIGPAHAPSSTEAGQKTAPWPRRKIPLHWSRHTR